MLYVPTENK